MNIFKKMFGLHAVSAQDILDNEMFEMFVPPSKLILRIMPRVRGPTASWFS
jgi:hypothetical protein